MKRGWGCRSIFVRIFRFGLLAAAVVRPAVAAWDGRTLRVPEDYERIGAAVAAARDGDTVLVGDGFYFEKNLVLGRRIRLKAKNLFGAVIVGSPQQGSSILIVRAPVEIEGFVFKHGYHGIQQRDSPDVEWRGRDLAFLDVHHAVSIDDRERTVGSTILSEIIVDGADSGLTTNDACGLAARRVFVSRTETGLGGSHHRFFLIDDAILVGCRVPYNVDIYLNPRDKRGKVDVGPGVEILASLSPDAAEWDGPARRLRAIFSEGLEAPDAADRTRRRNALISLLLAEMQADAGRWETAVRFHREALEGAIACDLTEVRWRADYGLARAAEAAKDFDAAIGYYKTTVGLIEASGLKMVLSDDRAGYFQDKAPVYERLIRLLVKAHIRNPAAGYARQALAYVERAGARVRFARAEGDRPALRSIRNEMAAINREISRLQTRLQEPRLPDFERRARLEDLTEAEARHWDQVVRAVKAEGARPATPEPVLSVLPFLDDSTAVLRYFVGTEASYAFLIRRSGIDVMPLPGESEIRGLVERYRYFLTFGAGGGFMGWEGGSRLARLLLGPFRARWAGAVRRLIVIPDGALHFLPFEALVVDPTGRRFLIEEADVRYAVSLAGLGQATASPFPARPRDFAGLSYSSPLSLYRFSSGAELRLRRLRGASDEIRRAAAYFPPGRSVLLEEAGESDLKKLHLADFRVIHIAAHGLIDDRSWWRSALLLGRGGVGGEDGFFQPREIFDLRLGAELVVLSGCETGTGPFERGEGIQGLTMAFLRAGARSLIYSLWSVEDRATASLMEAFYRSWREGAPKSAALRQAKLEALRSPLRHPAYWAGFVQLGD